MPVCVCPPQHSRGDGACVVWLFPAPVRGVSSQVVEGGSGKYRAAFLVRRPVVPVLTFVYAPTCLQGLKVERVVKRSTARDFRLKAGLVKQVLSTVDNQPDNAEDVDDAKPAAGSKSKVGL